MTAVSGRIIKTIIKGIRSFPQQEHTHCMIVQCTVHTLHSTYTLFQGLESREQDLCTGDDRAQEEV